ncbi:MAG: hypothetical protein LC114_05000 [Bryobacterales bacterium]|nr:hypothetical protein [Bryobacterales bacterium]
MSIRDSQPSTETISARERVLTALRHITPDRTPVDFLATNEIWDAIKTKMAIKDAALDGSVFFDPSREAVLRQLQVDCRVLSYDMFCDPPTSALHPDASVEWWNVLSRSTPNRMWRQVLPTGEMFDIFGRHTHVVRHDTGAYEEAASWPLESAQNIDDLRAFNWPEPDWWDFSPIPEILMQLDRDQHYHIRFRIGSMFEVAWQLRGMQTYLMDLAMNPAMAHYFMERLTEVYVENTRRVLEIAGNRLDMVYFYDDVATQKSLMISKKMWREFIQPYHQRIIDVAKQYSQSVMYHSDGAMYQLIPELIDMGIDVLNPIQVDAEGMAPQRLKDEFGDRLSFHGGIDIIDTLPRGTTDDVRREVRDRVTVLGCSGGYVMASSHHIQSDTPLENVLAMYELALRQPPET